MTTNRLEEKVLELENQIKKLNNKIAKIKDIEEDVINMTINLKNHDEDITRIKASIDFLNRKIEQ